MKKETEKILRDAYYAFDSPTNFASFQKVRNALKDAVKDVKAKEIEDFLLRDNLHSLYKPPKKFVRRKIMVKSIWESLSLDLADFQSLKKVNRNFGYLLVCICNFSKFLVIRKIKKKTKICMEEAVRSILEDSPVKKGQVKFLNVDRGNEFTSLSDFLQREYGIRLVHVDTSIKSAQAERIIQTVQRKLFKILEFEQSLEWVKYIDLVVSSYNNTKLKSLGYRSPQEVINDPKAIEAVKRLNAEHLLDFYQKHDKPAKYEKGTLVRNILPKGKFQKGYIPRFSSRIRTIASIQPTIPVTYRLRDADGRLLARAYYEPEISPLLEPRIKNRKDLLTPTAESKDLPNPTAESTAEVAQPSHAPQPPHLYVAEEIETPGRQTRSGFVSNKKKEYRIKSTRDSDYNRLVDEKELQNLRNAGKISKPPV